MMVRSERPVPWFGRDWSLPLTTLASRPTQRPLRVAVLAPPLVPVPPPRYGGLERVVALLADGLHERGHEVTVFAAGDSTIAGRLVPVVPRALWEIGFSGDVRPYIRRVAEMALARASGFDVIHSHLEQHGFALARRSRVPVVSTMHGRLDEGPAAEALRYERDMALIAVSHSQRRWQPEHNWLATIHNAILPATAVGDGAGGYLCFVGRVTPEKGIADAIELARRVGLPLRLAAKVYDAGERAHYVQVVEPAIRDGVVEFVGELGREERDALYAGALATVMLGEWPEPFGLVAAESLAVGTPVIARRAGALVEIVRPGIDGYIVDSVAGAVAALGRVGALDRAVIRAGTVRRFSAERMVRQYEAAYHRLLALAELDARRATPPPFRLGRTVAVPDGGLATPAEAAAQNV
jgi:glycosyltransferase involved in cell wall biosynthesis